WLQWMFISRSSETRARHSSTSLGRSRLRRSSSRRRRLRATAGSIGLDQLLGTNVQQTLLHIVGPEALLPIFVKDVGEIAGEPVRPYEDAGLPCLGNRITAPVGGRYDHRRAIHDNTLVVTMSEELQVQRLEAILKPRRVERFHAQIPVLSKCRTHDDPNLAAIILALPADDFQQLVNSVPG